MKKVRLYFIARASYSHSLYTKKGLICQQFQEELIFPLKSKHFNNFLHKILYLE